MSKKNIERAEASRVIFDGLEEYARMSIQRLLQELLEEEVTELLGRKKSQRCATVLEGAAGYRNGYGKARSLSMSIGTITLRRPRVRGLEERFVSRLIPLFKRRTKEVGELIPQLYLHGLSQGDFELALRGLLGDGAPLSASSVGRLKAHWQIEYDEWKRRSLVEQEVVYLWVDGVYVKAGLEKEKAALLVAVGVLRDGRKVVLAVEPGHRESTEAWSAVLRDLKQRGMRSPRLVIGDGHLGIWGALRNVFPDADEQRCWNHRMVNVLDKVPKKEQRQAKLLLTAIPYAQIRQDAERLKGKFDAWCEEKRLHAAAEILATDWERMVAFYSYPSEHWRHLRTTNVIESPFAALRLRTDAAKRFKKVDNATAIIWKTLLVAEAHSFRRLNAPELLTEIAEGARYADGKRVRKEHEKAAA